MAQPEYQSISLEKIPTWDPKKLLADIASAKSAHALQQSILTQADICTFIVQHVSFRTGSIVTETHADDLFKGLQKDFWYSRLNESHDDEIQGYWLYILAEITTEFAQKGAKRFQPFSVARAIRYCIDDIAGPIMIASEEVPLTKSEIAATLEDTKALLTANVHHINALLDLGIFTGKITMKNENQLRTFFREYPIEYIRRKPIKAISVISSETDCSAPEKADASSKEA